MVQFGTGYYMPMDREYGHSSPSDNSTNDLGVGVGDVGMSIGLGPVPNVSAVSAKMRAGTKTMELGFMGAGKGSAQGHTPEYYGKKQRQALREMQKANEFNFTTHASVGIMGLAGMDQQGNFSAQQKKMALDEIKRAVEFAADVAEGGPVVVHTGEFQRPLSEIEDPDFNKKFKMYGQEDERATFRVVDDRTGGVIQEARKNRKVARPVWLRAETDHQGEDEQGNSVFIRKGEYIDYFGKKVKRAHRCAKFGEDEDQQKRFLTTQMTWEDFKIEANEMTTEAKAEWEYWNKQGRPDVKTTNDPRIKNSIWQRFMNPEKYLSKDEVKVKPEEAYIIATLETNAAHSRGWALNYSGQFEETIGYVKKLEQAKKFYEQVESTTDPDEKWRLKKEAQALAGGLVPLDAELPTVIINKQLDSFKKSIQQAKEASASQWAQAEEAMEQIKHVQSAESYALNESFDSYAEAGIKAMYESDKIQKKGQLKKPIAVAMENLFPESYGAHPDELKKLIVGSRERMAQMLKKQGYSEEQAKKEAQEHITATFDTGHLNMWRKYWQGDENKSIEENNKEFKNWITKKVEMLAKDKIVGHLHLVDNYGYQDDHLAPGEGNTPIVDIVKIFKKHGFKGEMIVEPGADWGTDLSGFHSVMKTWKLFGSSIYGAAGTPAPRGRAWGEVQYGYFGQNAPPYFSFGGYVPSEDWRLWSGVPLE